MIYSSILSEFTLRYVKYKGKYRMIDSEIGIFEVKAGLEIEDVTL